MVGVLLNDECFLIDHSKFAWMALKCRVHQFDLDAGTQLSAQFKQRRVLLNKRHHVPDQNLDTGGPMRSRKAADFQAEGFVKGPLGEQRG
mgnify:CR=1 FL=1